MIGLPSWDAGHIGPNPESVKERLNEKAIEEGHNPSLGHLHYHLPP